MRFLATLALLAVTAPARAQDHEAVVLASPERMFATALDDALAPAGMRVVVVAEATTPTLSGLSAESRELADREHATATVWLLQSPSGATLVAYDRFVDRMLVRQLPFAGPLSATQAAEAARMVRTMLRALRTTTEEDKPQASGVGPPPQADPSHEPEAPGPSSELPDVLSVSAGAGVRVGSVAGDAALDADLAVAWRPRALGAAVTATLSPSDGVTTPAFAGHASDAAFALEARWPLHVGGGLSVVTSAGAALHVIRLRGDLDHAPIDETRFDPAGRLGVAAVREVARSLDIGVGVSADCLLQRQRFLSATEEILVVRRVQLSAGIVVSLRIL